MDFGAVATGFGAAACVGASAGCGAETGCGATTGFSRDGSNLVNGNFTAAFLDFGWSTPSLETF